jgi:putative transposase
MTVVAATLEAIRLKRPEPTVTQPQHLGWDKGDDDEAVHETRDAWGYTAPIRHRGEAVQATRAIPGDRARRWVVERPHAWMNRVRRWLIRGEQKVATYRARRHCACAWLTFRAAELFG